MPPPFRRAAVLAALALSALACAASPEAPEPLDRYPQAEVVVEIGAARHAFRVWVADTQARRSQGLMRVRSLEPGRGMLFPFDPPQVAAFWMKDTPLSLDLIFIGAESRIVNIAERARPYSTVLIESAAPVIAVLEVAAGTAARLGIRPGDRVQLPEIPHRPR